MNNKEFDKLVRDALGKFEKEYTPEAWERFQEKLHKDNLPLGEEDSFDLNVKNLIHDYQVSKPDNAWNLFHEKMDASLHNNYVEELDRSFKNRLYDYRVPYDPSTWPILEQKIIQRRQYIRKLLVTKAIEAAIVLFAIFTFYHNLPYYQHLWQDNTVREEITEVQSKDSPKTDSKSLIDRNLYPAENILSTESNSIPTSDEVANAANQSLDPASQDMLNHNPELNSVSQALSDNIGQNSKIKNTISSLMNTDNYNQPLAELTTLALLEVPIQSELAGDVVTFDQLNKRLNPNPNLDHLPMATAGVDLSHNMIPFNTFSKSGPKDLWLNVYGSSDIHLVNVSGFKFLDLNNEAQIWRRKDVASFNYGAGVSVMKGLNRIFIEGGLQYSNIAYSPNNTYKTGAPSTGKSEIIFDHIDLQMIQAPVSVGFYLSKRPKFNTYINGGMTFNLVAEAIFDVVVPPAQSLRVSGNNSVVDPYQQYDLLHFRSEILKQKEFEHEFYLSVNGGFGIDYLITERYKFYLQTNYHQPISKTGVGPNPDKLHSLSTRMGVRMAF